MRYLHTMLRVRNLDTAMKFYQDALGLKEVRRIDNDKGRFTLVFLCAPEDEGLARKAEILCSIPGVSMVTAAAILAEMPELGTLEAATAAKVPVMKDLDQYNLLVGIGFMAVGFTFATKWE